VEVGSERIRQRLVARSVWIALCEALRTTRTWSETARVRAVALETLASKISALVQEPVRVLLAEPDALLGDHVLATDSKHDRIVARLCAVGVRGLEFFPDPSPRALAAFLDELAASRDQEDDVERDLVARLRAVAEAADAQDLPAIRPLLDADLTNVERRTLERHATSERAAGVPSGRTSTAPTTPELVRDAGANLPVLLAGQVLDDVGEGRLPCAAAVPMLVDLEMEMFRRDDLAGIVWLLEWAAGAHVLGAGGNRVLRHALETAMTPAWFDRFLARAAGRPVEALGVLLLHVGEATLRDCLSAVHLPEHPEAHHVARTVAAVEPRALEEAFRSGGDALAELAIRALATVGSAPEPEIIAERMAHAGQALLEAVAELRLLDGNPRRS